MKLSKRRKYQIHGAAESCDIFVIIDGNDSRFSDKYPQKSWLRNKNRSFDPFCWPCGHILPLYWTRQIGVKNNDFSPVLTLPLLTTECSYWR